LRRAFRDHLFQLVLVRQQAFLGEVAVGDILQGLDGADPLALVVEQRGGGEKQPAAIAHVREKCLAFESSLIVGERRKFLW
jgi:hypothetical protein